MSIKTIVDPIADLYDDIAADEMARATYQWPIDISKGYVC
jgi:Mn-containing catalase